MSKKIRTVKSQIEQLKLFTYNNHILKHIQNKINR